ncbi:hypothetical protein ACFQS2_07685 [Brachybacterium sp. GCM10030267]|uniref:hypothetical protein n=1 Tax=unclassified Brachybacterium TaxID=2623841 RepID=UPI00361EBADA
MNDVALPVVLTLPLLLAAIVAVIGGIRAERRRAGPAAVLVSHPAAGRAGRLTRAGLYALAGAEALVIAISGGAAAIGTQMWPMFIMTAIGGYIALHAGWAAAWTWRPRARLAVGDERLRGFWDGLLLPAEHSDPEA